jgi:hypothetical protein
MAAIFPAAATYLETETVWLARYAPNTYENYVPDEADQFRKAKNFWEVGRLLTNASHFMNRAHNIPPSATESSLQPTSMRSISTFSSHRRLWVYSGQFLDSLKFLRIYQYQIFSYMLHANLFLWFEDIITSEEKYTKPVSWRTALGRKSTVPFPRWVQIFIFDNSFSDSTYPRCSLHRVFSEGNANSVFRSKRTGSKLKPKWLECYVLTTQATLKELMLLQKRASNRNNALY